ncbi:hypothetical protein CHUAL_005430 [Chamberlinius hualienensis]
MSYMIWLITISHYAVSIVFCKPVALVDLTYTYDVDMPTNFPFESMNRRTETIGDVSFQIAEFFSSEHAGTHMDAPYHFRKDHITLDKVPIEAFEGPGVVINIVYKADVNINPDASVTVEDIQNWETDNGLIQEGSIVLMYSGWGKYAGNKTLYRGHDGPEIFKFHFPGFSEEACKYLMINRKVSAIGTDTLSTDVGQAPTLPCHNIIAEYNGVGIENVANIDLLPPSGSYIRASPMKIAKSSGAPTRIIATLNSFSNTNS